MSWLEDSQPDLPKFGLKKKTKKSCESCYWRGFFFFVLRMTLFWRRLFFFKPTPFHLFPSFRIFVIPVA
jgi:hypothetical protein